MIVFDEQQLAVFIAPATCGTEHILNLKDADGMEQPDGFLKWKEAEDEEDHYDVAVVVENPYVRLCRLYDIYASSLRDRDIIPGRWTYFVESVVEERVEPYLRATITEYVGTFTPDYVIRVEDLYSDLGELGVEFLLEDQPEWESVFTPRDYTQYPITPQVRAWCSPDAEAYGYAGKLPKNLPTH